MSSESRTDRPVPPADNWYTQDGSSGAPPKSGRRWWLLGCLLPLPVLVCAGLVAGVAFFIFGLIKSSEPYVQSLAAAQSNVDLTAEIGQPIAAGMFVSGSVELENDNGDADLNYNVSGPSGRASIQVIATKNAGVWTYSVMQARVDTSGTVIDLRPQP